VINVVNYEIGNKGLNFKNLKDLEDNSVLLNMKELKEIIE
jgi:hypothetical protein